METITPSLQNSINYIGAKRTMLLAEREKINTIVLGSSHGDFAFNPAYCPGSFNLCCRSQDLKHSFFLYSHVVRNCPGIKYLVLFYSVFSPGFILEKNSAENEICLALNELFSLDINYDNEKLKSLSASIKGKLGDFAIEMEGVSGFLPKNGKAFFSDTYGAERRANDHIKYNKINEANHYLVELLSLAKQLGHGVCIVISPVRSDYRMAFNANVQSLFKSLFDVLGDFKKDGYVELLNCFDDDRFSDNDFGDYDHLLPLGKGTETLSILIKNIVNEKIFV